MSSDSDEISPQNSPVIVDYNDSAPNSPMPSDVSSVNSNSFGAKEKAVNCSSLKSSFVPTNSEVNQKFVNKLSIPFSITSILKRDDPIDKYHKQHSNASIGELIFQLLVNFRYLLAFN